MHFYEDLLDESIEEQYENKKENHEYEPDYNKVDYSDIFHLFYCLDISF